MLFPFHDSNPIRRTPWVTYGLVALNAVAFLVLLQAPPAAVYRRGFVPARIGQLVDGEPIVVEFDQPTLLPAQARPVNARAGCPPGPLAVAFPRTNYRLQEV